MRAFASAALLRALGPPWSYKADPAQPSHTLIQLLTSLRVLPIDFTSPTIRLVAWLLLHTDPEGVDGQVVYYGVALLWLALHRSPPPSDGDLILLPEWIVRRVSEFAKQLPGGFDRWLLGICAGQPLHPIGSHWGGSFATLT